MEPHAATGCVNVGCLTSTLAEIPYQKLTDLYYLSRGGFGTVFKAQHCDWRTTVAIKCLKLDSPFGERYRVRVYVWGVTLSLSGIIKMEQQGRGWAGRGGLPLVNFRFSQL